MLKQLVKECSTIYQVHQQHNIAAMNSINGKNIQDILYKLDDNKISQFLFKHIQDNSTGKIHYINAQSCPQNTYSIGIFILDENSVLPLHDHPLMVAASKVLCGIGQIETYTLKSNHQIQLSYPHMNHNHYQKSSQSVSVKDHQLTEIKQGQILWTYPIDRNIHSFSNNHQKRFAFLDVIVPYYDFKERFCNFYERSSKPDELQITNDPDEYADIKVINVNLDLNEFFL